MLFLNKTDVFRTKIAESPLSKYFSNYNGGSDYDKACTYMKNGFLSKVKKRDVNTIFTHYTCALSSRNVKFVVDAIRTRVLSDTISDLGL